MARRFPFGNDDFPFGNTVQLLIDELKAKPELKYYPWKDLDKKEQRRMAPILSRFPLKGFVNRRICLQSMLEYLQACEDWKNPADPKQEKFANGKPQPMSALQCGPGGGKSKTLSMFAGTIDLTEEITDPEELALYKELQR